MKKKNLESEEIIEIRKRHNFRTDGAEMLLMIADDSEEDYARGEALREDLCVIGLRHAPKFTVCFQRAWAGGEYWFVTIPPTETTIRNRLRHLFSTHGVSEKDVDNAFDEFIGKEPAGPEDIVERFQKKMLDAIENAIHEAAIEFFSPLYEKFDVPYLSDKSIELG